MSKTRRWGTQRSSLAVRVGIALCLALLLGLTVSYVSLLRSGNASPRQTDFVAYYAGARMVLQGHAAHLYGIGAISHVERALVSPLRMRYGSLPYVYPPFFAAALAPLAALPYVTAFGLWCTANLGLLGITVGTLRRYASLGRGGTLLFVLASVSWLPVFAALTQGQTSLVTLACLTLSLLALRTRHQALGGGVLALALIKPPLVAPVVLVLAVQRRSRALAGFVAATLALVAVPTALFGFRVDTGYLRMLQAATGWHTQFGYNPPWNQSYAGASQLLFPPAVATAVTAVLVAASVLLLAFAARRQPDVEAPMALAIITGILISPHVLIHDLALLILPCAVALRFRDRGPGWLGIALAVGSAAVLFGARLAFVVPIQTSVIAMVILGYWLLNVQFLEGQLEAPAFGRLITHQEAGA